jgi:hypothetical protein
MNSLRPWDFVRDTLYGIWCIGSGVIIGYYMQDTSKLGDCTCLVLRLRTCSYKRTSFDARTEGPNDRRPSDPVDLRTGQALTLTLSPIVRGPSVPTGLRTHGAWLILSWGTLNPISPISPIFPFSSVYPSSHIHIDQRPSSLLSSFAIFLEHEGVRPLDTLAYSILFAEIWHLHSE